MKVTKKIKLTVIGLSIFLPSQSGLMAQNTVTPDLQFEIKNIDTQKALVIKAEVLTSEMESKMGEMYKKLYTYFTDNKIIPAGPPFAVYYSYEPGGKTTFEAGIPVSKQEKGTGEIVFKAYEPIKVLKTTYIGSYDKMAEVYNQIGQHMIEQKLESLHVVWEVYLTDPSTTKNPADNKTWIYFTIK